MRVTQNTLFNGLRHQMQSSAARLLQAQEQAATQKRINRLSDDVIDGGRVVDLQGALSRSNQYLKNIERTNDIAGMQDGTLGDVTTLLSRAKELLLKESNEATSSAATREATRLEIATLTSQLLQIGNTRYDGQYVFSGFATNTPAFSESAISVAPGAIAGRGAVTQQAIADPTQLTYHGYQVNFTAPGVFDVVDTTLGATVLSGQTYASGQPIRFDGIELTIANTPAAPLAGDSYAITSTQPGTYQGDGQLQQIEIQPGEYVAQNISGDRVFKGVGIAGGVDLFSIMNQVNDALRNNDQAAMSALLDGLDAAQAQVSNERSNVGAKVNLLEGVKTRQEDIKLSLETLRSNLEDIDLADAITELQKQQTAYEATLSASSRIVQPSLLDFLR